MILYMISCLTRFLSYRYHTAIYEIIYDIITKSMISYVISQTPLFYPFLVSIFFDITHDNIAEIMDKGYDIKIT